jgi:phospholipid/cholesterol/gamma-HCH transport system permease protein
VVTLSGDWVRTASRPPPADLVAQVRALAPHRLRVEADGLTSWDSALLAYLLRVRAECRRQGLEVETAGLPQGLQTLVRLATAVPERETAPAAESSPTTAVHQVGHLTLEQAARLAATIRFVGESSLAVLNVSRGRARFRWPEVAQLLHACGPEAFGIISLIGFLMGLILAFVGAIQLRMFGAQIYVADLVGIGIVREMGAIMTGVVMAGRSGAAFAAQIGTMQVNDEVDAFRTMGINPVEFLVFPRMLALTLMMPLLCLYANAMGLLGGAAVGISILDLGLVQYWQETRRAVGLNDLVVGECMSVVFGVLVSLAGCLRGFQCGRSSLEVGRAATSAVVTGIVWIVVATAVMTVMCSVLGV